jgi:CheY-like chemotaxis protein
MMKILVVDDEADVQAFFLQLLHRNYARIWFDFATSGEALDFMKKDTQEIVLILSDIIPGMSGIELLSEIRLNYHEQAPVVMMITAYGDDENREQSKWSQ